jgi:2-oxo-4-hydroxy-4-carboxy-5-ureidoimidazoline decarboxylase
LYSNKVNAMSLAEFLNRLDEAAAREALTRCCAAHAWVDGMLKSRPFADDAAVLVAAEEIWWKLKRDDWLQAFAAHPRIGDLDSLRAKFADTRRWAGGEQSGVAGAAEATLASLATLNEEYAARFGYLFIVCATGKSADEMLALLAARLPNTPDAELPVAAAEQLKITRLRLQKLAP